MDEFIVAVTNWHEGVDLIISWHKNLFNFINIHWKALFFQFIPQYLPFLVNSIIILNKKTFNSSKHVFSMPKILVKRNLFNKCLNKSCFQAQFIVYPFRNIILGYNLCFRLFEAPLIRYLLISFDFRFAKILF